MANRIKSRDSSGPLTDREFLVLKRVAEGETHGDIAESLELSRGYISEQMSSAVSKVGCHNSHQACSAFGRYTAYHAVAILVDRHKIKEPIDSIEDHVNHVLDGLAAELRATAARLIPR